MVVTPSHNPPEDGGFKYNPPEGGPADAATTRAIETRANEIMADGLQDVRRVSLAKALQSGSTHEEDFVTPYVEDLANVIDMEAIAGADDPLKMARAMRLACEAGRLSQQAGRIPRKRYATASSPVKEFE